MLGCVVIYWEILVVLLIIFLFDKINKLCELMELKYKYCENFNINSEVCVFGS